MKLVVLYLIARCKHAIVNSSALHIQPIINIEYRKNNRHMHLSDICGLCEGAT